MTHVDTQVVELASFPVRNLCLIGQGCYYMRPVLNEWGILIALTFARQHQATQVDNVGRNTELITSAKATASGAAI